ncbi:hypothetical protein RHGRI_005753 [Rhododendron griersonianum]|uniref:Peptidase A1 domain-containing protein n=1 Tax=Rhododendron griersonianum TaxID=479676 RepID=A0AAV6LGB7_9ERIC|nr:hypothetical protein RHGRI_005753 [Rhododendron griersonianum]
MHRGREGSNGILGRRGIIGGGLVLVREDRGRGTGGEGGGAASPTETLGGLPSVVRGSCYQQQEPIFNPSASQTYKNLSCTAPQCSQLLINGCTGATNICDYEVIYADGFFTIELLATETLTLTPFEVFPGFAFGWGLQNTGPSSGVTGFSGLAGLLGLGRSPLPRRANRFKIRKLLLLLSSYTIYLPHQELWYLEKFFRHYNRLRHLHYISAAGGVRCSPEGSPFDTCYDFSGRDTVEVLTISFLFGGDVEVPIPFPGILTGSKELNYLAFAGNSDASDFGVFGNWQQQTLDVVYDVASGKIGFGTGGCS